MRRRKPRILLDEQLGPYRCVITGRGAGHFGEILPAIRITVATGPGLMDWSDLFFNTHKNPAVLRAAWERVKQRNKLQEHVTCSSTYPTPSH